MKRSIMSSVGMAAVVMAANTDANSGPGQEVGRKLSVGEMGWNKPTLQKLVIGDQENSHFLARFIGVATGVKPYKDKETQETKFGIQGQFQGIDADGVTKDGTVLYLPGYLNDMVVNALSISDDVISVRIGFDIYAKYDETSATSYVFTGRDLIGGQQSGVEEVKAQIQALPMPGGKSPLALAAPEAAKK
jgi:hypothetical protein